MSSREGSLLANMDSTPSNPQRTKKRHNAHVLSLTDKSIKLLKPSSAERCAPKSKPRKRSAINGWLPSDHTPSSALPYIAPPDIYTVRDSSKRDKKHSRQRVAPPNELKSDKTASSALPSIAPPDKYTERDSSKRDNDNKHIRKRVPPPKMNKESPFDKTVNSLIDIGFKRSEVLECIQDVNLRLLWNIDSFCLIYSRRKEKWFRGEIVGLYINENTKEKWFNVKYNNGNTKRMQRFNKNIKPIDLKYESNVSLIQIICGKLKSNELKVNELVDELAVFKEQNDVCAPNDATKCSAINRLIVSLIYYSSLNKEINIYRGIVNDYIHFKRHHQHQSHEINKYLRRNKGFKQNKTVNNNNTLQKSIYKDIMDCLHFYFGLNITPNEAEFKRIKKRIQEKINNYKQ